MQSRVVAAMLTSKLGERKKDIKLGSDSRLRSNAFWMCTVVRLEDNGKGAAIDLRLC